MEGQRHNNPLKPRCFCLQLPKRDGTNLTLILTHIIVEVAKALGGSFKLVTPAPKPVSFLTRMLYKKYLLDLYKFVFTFSLTLQF